MKIHIKDIKVSREESPLMRSRKDFGDLSKLADSIKTHGLMHPIVVEPLEPPEGSYKYRLLAGERRLRAVIFTGGSEIDATLWTDLKDNDYERKTLELEENVMRKDLEWSESTAMLLQLHRLKQSEFGVASDGDRAVDQGWGIRDTATSLGMSVGSCAGDLKLAEIVESRPDILQRVRKLPKLAARKIANQLLRAEELKLQIASKEIKITCDLRLGKCEELIDSLEDRSVDMLLTDPPFGNIGIIKAATVKTATYNFNEGNVSSIDEVKAVLRVLFPKLARKLKVGAHCYIFTGMGWSYWNTLQIGLDNGILFDEMPLIWHKERVSVMAKDYHYMPCYQSILFGHNQERKRALVKPVPNVLDIPSIAPQMRTHPLQLPYDLLQLLIENSSHAGELVLDCFAGSGSTLQACKLLQRRAVGFEKDEGNYSRAIEWLGKS